MLLRRLRLIRRFRLRNMEFAVVEMAPIAAVDSYPNGQLPDSVLESWTLPQRGGGSGRLCSTTMRKWKAMVFLARIYGDWTLTATSRADMYRDLGQQTRGFLSRFRTSPTGSSDSRVWNAVRYYLTLGKAGIAVPGTSNHGKGRAVDHGILLLGLVSRPVAWLTWAKPWFYRTGWSWEASTEDWHVRDVTGDQTPPVVEAVERCVAGPRLLFGSTGPEVARLQTVVGAKPDGNWGARTDARVRLWQAAQKSWYGGQGLPVDGIWDADDYWAAYEAATAETDPGVDGLAAA